MGDLFSAESESSTTQPESHVPLATRMRPRDLSDHFVGQEHILGPGKALRRLLERGEVPSLVLWGPPGSGKTTLAHVIAASVKATLVPFNATSDGVSRLREIAREAEGRRKLTGRGTICFLDEAHRLSKSQQDVLLPILEAGTFILVAATTENPSFSLTRALLSRAKVFVLRPLDAASIRRLLDVALTDAERGLGGMALSVDEDALELLTAQSDGDARRALTALETAAALAGEGGRVTIETAREALGYRYAQHDGSGDAHFDLISAYQKSVRGSNPDAAIYWLARMIEAGENPLYILRRLVVIASEDIGLADPQALVVATAALQAFQFVGPPEGYLALAEATLYAACAPKSNRSYVALGKALELARETPAMEVPLHLRNAPTALLRALGAGRDYEYPFDRPDHFSPQEYLPDELCGTRLYEPSEFGYEKRIGERMAWWADRKSDS